MPCQTSIWPWFATPPDAVAIHFDTRAFYDDLIAVCHEAITKQWDGRVMTRYNEWLTLNLRKEKAAIKEIDKFWPLAK